MGMPTKQLTSRVSAESDKTLARQSEHIIKIQSFGSKNIAHCDALRLALCAMRLARRALRYVNSIKNSLKIAWDLSNTVLLAKVGPHNVVHPHPLHAVITCLSVAIPVR